jgi:lysophospholipase L1-like esterase
MIRNMGDKIKDLFIGGIMAVLAGLGTIFPLPFPFVLRFVVLFSILFHGQVLGKKLFARNSPVISALAGTGLFLAIQSLIQTAWFYFGFPLDSRSDTWCLLISMDKILVFGDSIAYGKWDSNGGWVALLRNHIDATYNIDKPGNSQVFNLGIPGEVLPRLAERFETELKMRIFPDEKNLVIIACGINDSCPNNWMTEKQTDMEEFKAAYEKIIKTARAHSCEIVSIGLTPVNAEKSKGLLFSNEEVKKYDHIIYDICEENKVPMLQLFDELAEKDFAELLVDAVHPNDQGHEMLFFKIRSFLEPFWK